MSNILIGDPHCLCREALCNYMMQLDPDLFIVGFDAVGPLEDRAREMKPDLVIVDTDMAGWDKLSLPETKLALIVRSVKEETISNSGVEGIFPRNISSKVFLKGIHEILSGGTFFASDADMSETPGFFTKVPPHNFNLTGREKEVLSYLVKRQSNKDIARALDLQVVTVKLHVRGICRKIKAANRTQAALTAKENGWS